MNDSLYYLSWPKSLYNRDLDTACTIVSKYLQYANEIITKKPKAIVIDCDGTIFFDDPAQVLGLKEMEFSTKQSDNSSTFILPINKEVRKVANTAKMLGFKVIFFSGRPNGSHATTKFNLDMFDVSYDDVLFPDLSSHGYCPGKWQIIEQIKENYTLMCVIGDQKTDCYGDFFVKLPSPDDKSIKIYNETDYVL